MTSSLQRTLFDLSCGLTHRLPRTGARLLDSVLLPLLASDGMDRHFAARDEHVLARLPRPGRILVLADIHLGDAVMHQSMITTLRDFFPSADIHYAVCRSAACLIAGNPEITQLEPIYAGGLLPGESDLQKVALLCRDGRFDLVVNACPFFVQGRPFPRGLRVLNFMNHASQLLRNEMDPGRPNHFLYQARVFLHRALLRRFPLVRHRQLRGVELRLADAAHEEASEFLEQMDWPADGPLVLISPDTGSPFTRPPFELLVQLLDGLARAPVRLLLGEGHTDRGIGHRLRAALSPGTAGKVRIVPAVLRADSYAALTDLVDVFVSGDTGPLHWAAARKCSLSGRHRYRNRTSVLGLFGATPARMSGYDSLQPGFLPAWQEAPSTTFVSDPPCRNVTCLNKLQKTCRVARCFEGLAVDPIVAAIARNGRAGVPTQTPCPAAGA